MRILAILHFLYNFANFHIILAWILFAILLLLVLERRLRNSLAATSCAKPFALQLSARD